MFNIDILGIKFVCDKNFDFYAASAICYELTGSRSLISYKIG